MSAVRKIAISIVTLLAAFCALFLTTGTASADCGWNSPTPCAAP